MFASWEEEGTNLDHIRPHDLLIPPTLPFAHRPLALADSAQQLVLYLIECHDRRHREAVHVAREELRDRRYVTLLHFTQAPSPFRKVRSRGQLVCTYHARDSHVARDECELYVDQF